MQAGAGATAPPTKCLGWAQQQQWQLLGPRPSSSPPPAVSSRPPPPPVASCLSDLVELNVGGTLFTTNRATLEESQPQSMLAALVSGRHGPPRRDAQVRGAEG